MIAAGMQFGRYEVGARLGTGGFGVVHHARDVELGRDIAIKFLKPLYMTRPPLVQRCLREARAAAKVGHPGIVTVFECGQVAGTGQRADGNVFIAMELLRGESLADRLERAGRLSPALAISIGRQLASALAAAHKAGIIHRDLKPDNVFLVPDPAVRGGERAKILDFGIAKLTEPQPGLSTHSQVILGTPGYMSPEQARSPALVDHRSDIYALGCILFEALCGRAPYCGDPSILIALHQSAPVPSTRTSAPTTPIDLDRLVTSMLAKAPEDRPDSMDAIAETLGAYESTSRGVLALGPMPEPENEPPIDPFEPTGEATILRPSLSRIQLRRRA
ncbi:MAG: serine/threonine-protein kinase, partial [Kofleriaceae bacterium]